MSIPDAADPAPATVRALAGDATLEAVWRNAIGGLTFRASGGDGIRYIKWRHTQTRRCRRTAAPPAFMTAFS